MSNYMRGFVIHHLNEWNNLPVMERWFHREHAPDVKHQTPWLKQYHMYRAVNPAPEGAENFCFMNYRVHETVLDGMPPSMNGLPSMRFEPVENAMNVAMYYVPILPDRDLWGAQRTPYSSPFIRWVTVFKYPEGVDKKEAEDWYFNVHCPEVIKKSEKLVRYFSYNVYPSMMNAAEMGHEQSDDGNFHLPFVTPPPNSLLTVPFDRHTEMWFESGEDWTRFVKEVAPTLTKPSWATQDEYPWVVPGKEFCSTFLLERPTEDLMATSEDIYYG